MTTTAKPNAATSLLNIIAYLLRAVLGAYGLSTALHVALHLLIGPTFVPIAFFDTFAHLLWSPALLLLPLALLLRFWIVAGLLLPAVLAFALTFGPAFVPSAPSDIAPATERLTLLTYNILATNRSLDEVIDVIAASDADIVGLQEVGLEAGARIADQLAELYPHQATYAQANAFRGQALLSRYPIANSDYWQYQWLDAPLGNMRATVQLDEHEVTVYNLHPVHPGIGPHFFDPSYRYREMQDIARRIDAETLPVIALGDFNMPLLSPDYALMSARLADAYRDVGWGLGLTFPSWRVSPALLRLDYVFYDPVAFAALSARVLADVRYSDHHPLFVELAFNPR
jgi:vancomycin resistance protein VanJ